MQLADPSPQRPGQGPGLQKGRGRPLWGLWTRCGEASWGKLSLLNLASFLYGSPAASVAQDVEEMSQKVLPKSR